MNSMVTTDTQSIPIACNDPHAQFGSGSLQSTGNCCSTAMDRVHTIRVHIIGEAAAAADTGNDYDVFLRNTQTRHNLLHLCQNGIVSATGAPAYFLVGGKIFWRQSGCCSFTHRYIITAKLSE